MSNNSAGTGLPTNRKDEQQKLPPRGQSYSKIPRNDLTLIKKLPQQIKELAEQNARIELELHGMNKDIKQISHTQPAKIEIRESITQIHSRIVQLQTHISKIGNAVDYAFANMKSRQEEWQEIQEEVTS
jgi:hypothetical protein